MSNGPIKACFLILDTSGQEVRRLCEIVRTCANQGLGGNDSCKDAWQLIEKAFCEMSCVKLYLD